jgi:hypothetical protein
MNSQTLISELDISTLLLRMQTIRTYESLTTNGHHSNQANPTKSGQSVRVVYDASNPGSTLNQ